MLAQAIGRRRRYGFTGTPVHQETAATGLQARYEARPRGSSDTLRKLPLAIRSNSGRHELSLFAKRQYRATLGTNEVAGASSEIVLLGEGRMWARFFAPDSLQLYGALPFHSRKGEPCVWCGDASGKRSKGNATATEVLLLGKSLMSWLLRAAATQKPKKKRCPALGRQEACARHHAHQPAQAKRARVQLSELRTILRYRASTFARAHGVFRRNLRLEETLGSLVKQRIGILSPILAQPYWSTRSLSMRSSVTPCSGS